MTVLLALLAACTADPAAIVHDTGGPCDEGLNPGECAPDFTLPAADGSTVTLSDHQGTIVVVEVSGMWCTLCRNLVPGLDVVYQALQPDMIVLNVLVDDNDFEIPDQADAQAWRDEYELTYPVLYDESESFATRWTPSHTVPATWVLSENGRVAWSEGRTDSTRASEVRRVVEELLDDP